VIEIAYQPDAAFHIVIAPATPIAKPIAPSINE
jgi:hypothetical protein